jgi:hypothetical protein
MVVHPDVIITHAAPPPPPELQSTEKQPATIPVLSKEEPEHLFTNAHDASYAIPQNCNYAGVFKPLA